MLDDHTIEALDELLRYRAKAPSTYILYDQIKEQYRNKYSNVKYLVELLVNEGLFHYVKSNAYSPFVMLTSLGQKVAFSDGGYREFKEKDLTALATAERKEALELQNLEQSVRINKFQFWIMMLGAIGGFISFLFLVYQFLFGGNGFFNDVFN